MVYRVAGVDGLFLQQNAVGGRLLGVGGCRTPYNYGSFRCNYYYGRAHRVSWVLHRGPIPEGLFVCHTCDNPPCCNPEHLFLGTAKDNKDDSVAKNRHAFGERSGNAILTDAQVREVMERYKPGKAARLAKEYGVTSTCIYEWISGRQRRSAGSIRPTGYRRAKKMTREAVLDIRSVPMTVQRRDELMVKYGISRSFVYKVYAGDFWKHVKEDTK